MLLIRRDNQIRRDLNAWKFNLCCPTSVVASAAGCRGGACLDPRAHMDLTVHPSVHVCVAHTRVPISCTDVHCRPLGNCPTPRHAPPPRRRAVRNCAARCSSRVITHMSKPRRPGARAERPAATARSRKRGDAD